MANVNGPQGPHFSANFIADINKTNLHIIKLTTINTNNETALSIKGLGRGLGSLIGNVKIQVDKNIKGVTDAVINCIDNALRSLGINNTQASQDEMSDLERKKKPH